MLLLLILFLWHSFWLYIHGLELVAIPLPEHLGVLRFHASTNTNWLEERAKTGQWRECGRWDDDTVCSVLFLLELPSVSPQQTPLEAWGYFACLSCDPGLRRRALWVSCRWSATKLHPHFALNAKTWNSFVENIIIVAKHLEPAVVQAVNELLWESPLKHDFLAVWLGVYFQRL